MCRPEVYRYYELDSIVPTFIDALRIAKQSESSEVIVNLVYSEPRIAQYIKWLLSENHKTTVLKSYVTEEDLVLDVTRTVAERLVKVEANVFLKRCNGDWYWKRIANSSLIDCVRSYTNHKTKKGKARANHKHSGDIDCIPSRTNTRLLEIDFDLTFDEIKALFNSEHDQPGTITEQDWDWFRNHLRFGYDFTEIARRALLRNTENRNLESMRKQVERRISRAKQIIQATLKDRRDEF